MTDSIAVEIPVLAQMQSKLVYRFTAKLSYAHDFNMIPQNNTINDAQKDGNL